MWKRILVLAVLMLSLLATGATAFAASGTGPGDAVDANGQTQSIAANTAQWYKFELGGKKADVTVTLDAASADGLRLAIYTPAQVAAYAQGESLKAVGLGATQKTHTLAWYGTFNEAGVYYAVLYNDTGAVANVAVKVESDALKVETTTTTATVVDPLQKVAPVNTNGISGKIAFVDATGGILYTVNGDGTNLTKVSFGMDPQWSNDGTKIALARQGPVAGVYTINADGSNETLLYATNEPRSPDWSPDDSQVVFSYQGATKGGGTRTFGNRTIELPSSTQWKLGLVNLSDNSYADVRSTENATTRRGM